MKNNNCILCQSNNKTIVARQDFEDLLPEHDRFLAQHLWYFSESVLEKIFRDSGFKVIKIESHNTIRERKDLVSLLLKE